jgi:hypothetical protein
MLMQSQNTSDSEMTEWRVPVDYWRQHIYATNVVASISKCLVAL